MSYDPEKREMICTVQDVAEMLSEITPEMWDAARRATEEIIIELHEKNPELAHMDCWGWYAKQWQFYE